MKKVILTIIITAIIVGSGAYLWQAPPQNQQAKDTEKVSEEAGLQEQGEGNLKRYSSQEYQISFEYPKQFFLLDRLSEDKSIYISPNPISFNEFLNVYYEPIEISLTDESEGNSTIEALKQKIVSQTNINGQNALVISGVIPERGPYYAYNLFAIIFPDKKISIVAADVFLQYETVDLETITRKIASTLKFE